MNGHYPDHDGFRERDAAQLFFQRLPSFLRAEGYDPADVKRIVKIVERVFKTVYG